MEIEFDARHVFGFFTFLEVIRSPLAAALGIRLGNVYCGWHLESFAMCLQGGYCGHPPFHFVGTNADAMVIVFERHGVLSYCDELLRIAGQKGTNRLRKSERKMHVEWALQAARGGAPSLLDRLLDVIREAPASLTLYGANGEILVQAIGEVDPRDVPIDPVPSPSDPG